MKYASKTKNRYGRLPSCNQSLGYRNHLFLKLLKVEIGRQRCSFVSSKHKFDVECKVAEIDHRLTIPYTPQTNGMAERVNGTIENTTIKAEDYKNTDDVKTI